jgi:predicted DNA-binding ribbon-helix-helix protein
LSTPRRVVTAWVCDLSYVSGATAGHRQAEAEASLSGLIKRSFSLAGHRTSVALEEPFWRALSQIAGARGQTLSALVAAVDAARRPGQPLASALRVLALEERTSR